MARLLYLTTPHLRGADVHKVQMLLRRHGHSPGPIDGEYGATTAAAVRTLQRRYELAIDGIVGPATLRWLEHPGEKLPAVGLPGREPPGIEALAWMAQRLGLTESPPNTNRCPITREFGLVGPWCMMTVSLAFKHGANLILGDDTPHPWAYWDGRGFAYVPAFEAWARARGFYRGRRGKPEPGWIVAYSFGHTEAVHVGVVERYLGGSQFNALEGNTALGNDSNGGELMRRRRYLTQVHGFYNVTRHKP